MAEQTDLRRLLVLHGPALGDGVLEFLAQHFHTEVTEDLDSALGAMRSSHFDAVLAETADFLPLERGVVTQQAAAVLDTIGDGVCVVGSDGELCWTNRRARGYARSLLADLCSSCRNAYEQFAAESRSPQPRRGKRFSLNGPSGRYYEVLCSPIRDGGGILRQVAAVVVDATHQRRQQDKLNAIDRAGRELVRLDFNTIAGRDAVQRLDLLAERIIRLSKDVLDFQHFAVLLLDPKTNRLDVTISEGLSSDSENIELFSGAEGNGICGYVAATGRSYICPDVRKDPLFVPGMDNARSSLAVPLRLHDKTIGVFNVESDRLGAFGEEDRQFAEIFSNYVALALHILDLLVYERHSARSQVSGSISAELTGPLNDLITDATRLTEDYIGHDELRKRLGRLVDCATETRRMMRELTRNDSPGVLAAGQQTPHPGDEVLVGKRVLIADDEELIRQTIHDVLVRSGCEVDVASDGAEACLLLSRGAYDLVISDIKMPGANGYQVFAAARESWSCTAVILITAFGYDPHHSIVRARKEGLAAVLMKPFKVRQLLDECRSALTGGA